jgi:hypothetical protein
MAVGDYFDHDNGLVEKTLAETFNGGAWTILPTPNSSSDNFLFGVSCPGVGSCAAVGQHGQVFVAQTLIEMWDGTSWSIVPTPNRGSSDNRLLGVSCPSLNFCVAVGESVGQYVNGNPVGVTTLVETFDGTSWTITPSPNPNGLGTNSGLNSVSCTTPTNCVAAGGSFDATGIRTLVESWNGTTWSIVPTPSPTSGDLLLGVSCAEVTSCMAVGTSGIFGPTPRQTLAEIWNGSSWSVIPSPDGGPGENRLNAVSCDQPHRCVTVGRANDGTVNRSLVEAWDGTSLSLVPSPNQGSGDNELLGVSCSHGPKCVAGGWYFNPAVDGFLTLTMEN